MLQCGPDQQRPALKPSVSWPITRAWVTNSVLTATIGYAYSSTYFRVPLHVFPRNTPPARLLLQLCQIL